MNGDIAAISSQREEDRSVVENEEGSCLFGIAIVVGSSRNLKRRTRDVSRLCKL